MTSNVVRLDLPAAVPPDPVHVHEVRVLGKAAREALHVVRVPRRLDLGYQRLDVRFLHVRQATRPDISATAVFCRMS